MSDPVTRLGPTVQATANKIAARVIRESLAHPQSRNAAFRRSSLLVLPQVRSYLKRSLPKPSDDRIRPTHSPQTTADGLMNRSL